MTDEQDAEELLQSSQDSRRWTSEADDGGDRDGGSDQLSPLADAILGAYEDLEAGDATNQVQCRDDDLAAILEGLERQPLDLSRVVDRAGDELDVDVDDDPGKSDAVRLLLRIGLRTVDEETVDAWRAAKRERAVDGF